MTNLSANETATQGEIYLVKRELEALRDENYALRCYLKSADKQVEEVCKKVDFYMDEVIILRAENEALRKELQFFLEQSVIIEQKQDDETTRKLRKLRKKYGFK